MQNGMGCPRSNFTEKTRAVLVLLLTVSMAAPVKAAAGRSCNFDQTVQVVTENGSSVSGHGTLDVDKDELEVVVRARNLTPGVAYTTWFIYFDDPSQCIVPNQCAPPDLTTPADNPTGVFGRMDSSVAGPSGRLTFRGTFRHFHMSPGSAVHVALFAHGTVSTDNRERARQLLTPENPGLGAPGLGVGTQKGFLVAGTMFDISDRTSCK